MLGQGALFIQCERGASQFVLLPVDRPSLRCIMRQRSWAWRTTVQVLTRTEFGLPNWYFNSVIQSASQLSVTTCHQSHGCFFGRHALLYLSIPFLLTSIFSLFAQSIAFLIRSLLISSAYHPPPLHPPSPPPPRGSPAPLCLLHQPQVCPSCGHCEVDSWHQQRILPKI